MFMQMSYGKDEATLMAIEAEKAAMLLRWANSKSYKIMDSLLNQCLRDQTGYPWTLNEARGLLLDWVDSEPNHGRGGRDGVDRYMCF
jgi:hypothetical protein